VATPTPTQPNSTVSALITPTTNTILKPKSAFVRGYVVDVYFCVFDVSVEEFGAGLGFGLGFRLGIGFGIVLVD
jgi:hypothetical protein